MRGARNCRQYCFQYSRIIPADAGSTRLGNPGSAMVKDHPRGCGEHPRPILGRPSNSGSSPRMRGARVAGEIRNTLVGIIPADAGSTMPGLGYTDGRTDHPRGCGEHCAALVMSVFARGSSPRMRGAPRWLNSSGQRKRIIPADAGSTVYCSV